MRLLIAILPALEFLGLAAALVLFCVGGGLCSATGPDHAVREAGMWFITGGVGCAALTLGLGAIDR